MLGEQELHLHDLGPVLKGYILHRLAWDLSPDEPFEQARQQLCVLFRGIQDELAQLLADDESLPTHVQFRVVLNVGNAPILQKQPLNLAPLTLVSLAVFDFQPSVVFDNLDEGVDLDGEISTSSRKKAPRRR